MAPGAAPAAAELRPWAGGARRQGSAASRGPPRRPRPAPRRRAANHKIKYLERVSCANLRKHEQTCTNMRRHVYTERYV
jgi:hypothetical protein